MRLSVNEIRAPMARDNGGSGGMVPCTPYVC